MGIALEAAAISRSKSTWGSVNVYFTAAAPRRSVDGRANLDRVLCGESSEAFVAAEGGGEAEEG
ncbi:hypothetical protein, partial [Streptomyces diastaticus]|uniref:hypothetical protein n=1 Tax=Streptomyces diastaticus TaxID=1956 RepID=UPI001E5B82AC